MSAEVMGMGAWISIEGSVKMGDGDVVIVDF